MRATSIWMVSVSLAAQILACTCPANPQPDACVPQAEICDGQDNDCDGLVDRSSASEALTKPCLAQSGVCSGARVACVAGQFPACTAIEYGTGWQASETKCDGLDNDCDGLVDLLADGGPLVAACRLNAGVCAGKVIACAAGAFAECGAAEYGPNWENVEGKCDGLDNDCDGVVDQSRWVKNNAGYALSGSGTSAPDPYPSLFATDAGYVAQYGPRLWVLDRELRAQPPISVPDPNGGTFFAFFPSAVRLANEYAVMGTATQPANNFAWRFGLDGRPVVFPDGGFSLWSFGPSPGLFTLAAACSGVDGMGFLAGTISGTGQPYLLSVAQDGGALTPVTAAPNAGAGSRWSCASAATGYVVAIDDGVSTTFVALDANLNAVGAPRTVSGGCRLERTNATASSELVALCNTPSLVRGIFDGGGPEALAVPGVAQLIRTPREPLLAAYLDLGFRTQRLSLSSVSMPMFTTVQTAVSDHHIGVQAGEPGVVILMVDDVNASTISLSRLCYP